MTWFWHSCEKDWVGGTSFPCWQRRPVSFNKVRLFFISAALRITIQYRNGM